MHEHRREQVYQAVAVGAMCVCELQTCRRLAASNMDRIPQLLLYTQHQH